jgi:phosphatidylglycerophosphatase A
MPAMRDGNYEFKQPLQTFLQRALQTDRPGPLDFRNISCSGRRLGCGFRRRTSPDEKSGAGMKNRLSFIIASVFYVGYIPGAPGTYAAIITTLGFFLTYFFSHRILPELHLSAVGLISLIGVLASAQVSRSTGIEDPSFIVIDEVAGQLITFLFLPVNAFNLILGTVAFRIFDIWKPFPIRKLEHYGAGVGVMADDLLAGIYANLALQLLNFLI